MTPPWTALIFAVGLGVVAAVEAFVRGPRIEFLNMQQTRDFLASDSDGFIRSLSRADLSARQARSHAHYRAMAMDSALEYTIEQQERLRRLILAIDYNTLPLEQYGMSPSKFRDLPWKIALSTYEDEFPHTRGDVIFLSPDVLRKTDPQLTKTLIHEMVHVYQKMYPDDVRAFLHVSGYKEVGPSSMDALLRANPDLDGIVYRSPQGQLSGMRYRREAPTSITDAEGDPKAEHPLEVIAYTVSRDR